jgi:methylenetetrahydrofolate dehydrogenase (NADP+)/methenyltetrahydrofolate cyclohydrolase
MAAAILDGKQLAQTIQAEIAAEVAAFTGATGVRPGLAAILVGSRPDSQSYVRNKRRACEKVGITSTLHELPDTVALADYLALVERLNADPSVHGILPQLPLPKQLDEARIIDTVHPHKDVDGFSPVSLGLLAAGRPRYLACTPAGVLEMLRRHGVAVAGKRVAVLGRSNIVGKPMALILTLKGIDATVTVCHSRTPDLAEVTRQADVLIAAMGQPKLVRGDMVKPGAVVVDVGMNKLADGTWAGDVDFEAARQKASLITPVPGGVGPMTVTMLLHNTLKAARLQTPGAPAARSP